MITKKKTMETKCVKRLASHQKNKTGGGGVVGHLFFDTWHYFLWLVFKIYPQNRACKAPVDVIWHLFSTVSVLLPLNLPLTYFHLFLPTPSLSHTLFRVQVDSESVSDILESI